MYNYGVPHYSHYLRVGAITGIEAKWLLANFELETEDIYDKEDYDKALKLQMKLAAQVVSVGIESGDLKYTSIGFLFGVDENGQKLYNFEQIIIKIADFCSWAFGHGYTLPEIYVNLLKSPEPKEPIEIKDVDNCKRSVAPDPHKKANRGGKPKGYLHETVEHVFNKLLEQKEPGLLKKSKIRSFIIMMKEMANKNGRYPDEFVMERIKSINVPEEGVCTITTEDHVTIKGQNETIVRGKTHTINDVAKILVQLRKNNQITA